MESWHIHSVLFCIAGRRHGAVLQWNSAARDGDVVHRDGVGAFVPMPFRSNVTTGMDTKTKTVINGGIKAGREARKARVKLSGNVGTGRDS